MRRSGPDDFLFDTVAVVGVGLIGGSLGLAAKKRNVVRHVIGIGRTEQKLMRAKILGAIDSYSMDFENGAAQADLVVICTPVCDIVPTLRRMAGSLKDGAIVTDVGSTKAEVIREAAKVMPEGRYFVGGHPMAGSEQAGINSARHNLFEGATYVVTPNAETDLNALGRLTMFCDAIGANVEEMSPEQHDKAVAIISHLPHAMASALLHTAEDSQRSSGKLFNLAAGSFRDLTRISDSLPMLWRDICITNADSLCDAIGEFQGRLDELKEALRSRDAAAVESFFEQARLIRETYLRLAK